MKTMAGVTSQASEPIGDSSLFQSLLSLSDLLVVVLDAEGRVLLFNRSCETLTGYNADEMVGQSIWALPLIPVEEQPGILRAIARVRSGVPDFRHVNHWKTRSGQEHLIHWRATVLRKSNGHIHRLFATGIDITAQDKAMRARDQQRMEFRALFDAFPALVAHVDCHLHVRHTNHCYREWFDIEPDEQIGRHIREVIGLDAFHTLQPCFQAALNGETAIHHGEVAYSRGGTRYIHGTYVPSLNDAGKVDGFYILAVDISSEQRLKCQLAEETRRGKAIVDHALDGIVTIDASGMVLSFNPAAERIFGHAAKEVIGANISMLMPESLATRHDGFPGEYFEAGDRSIVGQRREVTGRHRDGSSIDLLLAMTEFNESGHFFIGYLHDITQRKQAERDARRHLTELAHVTRVGAMGELAAGLAHELSQPLTAIAANVEASLMRVSKIGIDDPILEPALRQIAQQSERAAEIIDYLRRFLRKEHDEEWSVCMPDELFDRVLMLLNHEIHAANVRAHRFIDRDVVPARLHRVQIEQVLFNLAKNAIDALATSGHKGVLELRCGMSPARDAWNIEVADNGPGIKPEYIERLFHPFFTTKANGLGQGLPICRSIIERHGGTLNGGNRPEGGMAFVFSLPVGVPDAA